MQINIINKLKHDKVTFELAAMLVIVVGVLGYIILSIQGPLIHLGPFDHMKFN